MTGCWGTQILALKWLAMLPFQGTGKVKALSLQHGRLQINCINSLAVIFSFQSVFEVRDSLIFYSAPVGAICTPGAVQG